MTGPRGGIPLAVTLLVLAVSCQAGRSPSPTEEQKSAAVRAKTGTVRPVFVHGPSGAPVAPFVANEVRKGRAEGFTVLVYVGATWCEPCQRFHHAVEAGELDTLLSGVHLVEFDLDESRSPLQNAGYRSELIPLFAAPRDDGTASDVRIEGSIKGESAVNQNLAPRIRLLLERARKG